MHLNLNLNNHVFKFITLNLNVNSHLKVVATGWESAFFKNSLFFFNQSPGLGFLPVLLASQAESGTPNVSLSHVPGHPTHTEV